MARRRKKEKGQGQKIVANMGLFWHRDKVRWRGDRKVGKARLGGVRAVAKKRGTVDFWTQTGIYALYSDYHLVYVGQAGLTDKSHLGLRLKQHLVDDLAGRWNMFSWFGLQRVKTTNSLFRRGKLQLTTRAHLANVLEGIVIEVAEPPMNNQKGRFGRKVERFLQVDDSPDEQEPIISNLKELSMNLKKTRQKLIQVVQDTRT